jgi:hypothetical protein
MLLEEERPDEGEMLEVLEDRELRRGAETLEKKC